METAMSTLHSLMVKNGTCPIYEFVSQGEGLHRQFFECRCSAFWITITVTAPSVRSAQEEAAKIMLLRLAQAGYSVPPPYNQPMLAKQEAAPSQQDAKPREMRKNEGRLHPSPNQRIADYHQGFFKSLDAEKLRKRREMIARYRQSSLAGKIAARLGGDNEAPCYSVRQKLVFAEKTRADVTTHTLDNLCKKFEQTLKIK